MTEIQGLTARRHVSSALPLEKSLCYSYPSLSCSALDRERPPCSPFVQRTLLCHATLAKINRNSVAMWPGGSCEYCWVGSTVNLQYDIF